MGMKAACTSAGKLVFPVKCEPTADADELAKAAGADLMSDAPEIAAWLKDFLASEKAKSVTIGVYTYLDGDAHVRVSLACDAIIQELIASTGRQHDLSLAYIQTP